MRQLILGVTTAFIAFGASYANDLTLPGTLGVSEAADALLGDPGGNLTVTSVALTAESTSVSCPAVPLTDLQFGAGEGFAGVNGIVLSNGYIEDLDDDGAATGHPSGCALGSGAIGAGGTNCNGTDAVMSAALTTAFGLAAPLPSEDASILTVTFNNTSMSTVDYDFNYSFTTFESPADPSFFDSFAIFFDGGLVAGGTTNLGSAPGTDGWVLAPGLPGEYQSIAPSGFHVLPANETGLRTVTVSVAPGLHTLEFHVADGGPDGGCIGTGGTPGCCNIVHSMLFVGPGRYQSGSATGVSSGPSIGRVGHPAPDTTNGGTFPADFQVTLVGAPPFSPIFFIQGNNDSAITIPLIAPLEILVGPPAFFIQVAGTTNGAGNGAFPAAVGPISSTIVGQTLFVQWFGIDISGGPPASLFNTKGLKVNFGA